jgi:uncharacterized protein (TIGR02246 family)
MQQAAAQTPFMDSPGDIDSMNKSLIAAAAALLIPAAAFAETTQQCATASKEQVAALFDRWNASLQTKNPEEVVKNYAEDAVLLPTVSNKPRTNPKEIADYFEHFVQKSPNGVINTRTIHVGCNDAYDVGTYTFTLTSADGKKSDVAARYSFVYELRDGKWLIVHHHSSAMPETSAAQTH